MLKAVPVYAKNYLQPAREKLLRRANIIDAGRSDWWGLSRHRTWALDPTPRIISKYFGGPGGFAADLEAEFVVVQGFAWFPKWSGYDEAEDGVDRTSKDLSLKDILAAYAAMMNSARFGRLLELFSPHVAGGQFDLSPRYVDAIPIPDFSVLATDERAGHAISSLSLLGQRPRLADAEWRATSDRLTTELYGEFLDQV
jgi:hypothetical protein